MRKLLLLAFAISLFAVNAWGDAFSQLNGSNILSAAVNVVYDTTGYVVPVELLGIQYNVEMFGAECDGLEDDEPEINAAIQELTTIASSNGARIDLEFPTGKTCAIGDSINLEDYVKINLNGGTVKWIGDAGGTMFTSDSGAGSDALFYSGVINGNIDPNSSNRPNMFFELHSPRHCQFTHHKLIDSAPDATYMEVWSDTQHATGHLNNTVYNVFGPIVYETGGLGSGGIGDSAFTKEFFVGHGDSLSAEFTNNTFDGPMIVFVSDYGYQFNNDEGAGVIKGDSNRFNGYHYITLTKNCEGGEDCSTESGTGVVYNGGTNTTDTTGTWGSNVFEHLICGVWYANGTKTCIELNHSANSVFFLENDRAGYWGAIDGADTGNYIVDNGSVSHEITMTTFDADISGRATLWRKEKRVQRDSISLLEGGSAPAATTTFQGSDQSGSDIVYTLPTAYPAADNYVLSSSATGAMSWVPPSGGSDTQVLYNNGGSLGGATNLTYDDTTGEVLAASRMGVNASSIPSFTEFYVAGDTGNGRGAGQFNLETTSTVFTATPAAVLLTNTANTNNTFVKLNFGTGQSVSASASIAAKLTTAASNYGELGFWTRDSSGFTEKLVVTGGGNLDVPTSGAKLIDSDDDEATVSDIIAAANGAIVEAGTAVACGELNIVDNSSSAQSVTLPVASTCTQPVRVMVTTNTATYQLSFASNSTDTFYIEGVGGYTSYPYNLTSKQYTMFTCWPDNSGTAWYIEVSD